MIDKIHLSGSIQVVYIERNTGERICMLTTADNIIEVLALPL